MSQRQKGRSSDFNPSYNEIYVNRTDDQLHDIPEDNQNMTSGNDSDFEDDLKRVCDLKMINASARYELIQANQQLMNFKVQNAMKQPNLSTNEAIQFRLDSQESSKKRKYQNPVKILQKQKATFEK